MVICIATWMDDGCRAGLGSWSGSSGWDVRWCLVCQIIQVLNVLWQCSTGDAFVIIIVWYDVGAHSWSGCAGVVGGGSC